MIGVIGGENDEQNKKRTTLPSESRNKYMLTGKTREDLYGYGT
jgi:hypothetical protein